MTSALRLTLAQLNPSVGDIAANAAQIRAAHRAAAEANSDLVAFPEMFLTGYQPQDLVTKPAFLADVLANLDTLADDLNTGPALLVGAPVLDGAQLFNCYILIRDGRWDIVSRKHHLPNYSVFDEHRVFKSGAISGPFEMGGFRIGCPICEDAWYPDVAETLSETGAEFLLIPNGSPYTRNKHDTRVNLMVARVIETGLPLIYLNMTGGQDDQVFDGGSFCLNTGGRLAAQMPFFEDAISHVEITRGKDGIEISQGPRAVPGDDWQSDYQAMVMALRDYLRKTGFSKVVLGLSGGIDSALVATIAVDALGADNVHCVMLPSQYTSGHSLEDAEALAKNLGVKLDTVSIGPAKDAVEATLAPLFAGRQPDITEENIQSRLRGVMLMALSNKFNEMLLTTGNKSEVAVGYATIYGDMNGGYNPIKDLYKTRVFETCRWRNANFVEGFKGPEGAVIPERIITKPPSAELRDDQKDEDSLPPYEVLDAILDGLIEQDLSVPQIVAQGYDFDTVKRVEHLLNISEYKRFQSAPGVKLSERAFWLDRRYPIANRWRDPAKES